MNIYDVIHLIQDMDNVDKIADILDRWEFTTSVISKEVIEEVKKSAIEIAKTGESKVYAHIKDAYGLKF